ncbi:polysaccharide biosynthesis protein [Rhizobium sp. CG4]|uniref:polysaccharide biosynthesis protein n=1 Tax=Rhizobium sp. CG4 TaxID=2726075 RepID=UPI0020332E37|nr:nucleoside-diphosphate sugar epimerase/dehydratase [Rhizobium sp. CG4]MCM2457999.1 polysaccharide biosynthesis protein [Rhizobium sp. CG4]
MKWEYITSEILALPRWTKRTVAVFVDSTLCVLTLWLAFSLRLDTWDFLSDVQLLTIPVSLAIALPLFIVNGLYRAIFRYIGWAAFLAIIRAIALYGLVFMLVFSVISVPGIPRTVGIMQPLLLLLAICISRLVTRQILGAPYRRELTKNAQRNVLIYGAGTIGRQLASALRNGGQLMVRGYLDDDKNLHGSLINGVRVYAPHELKEAVAHLNVKTVLLATPRINAERRMAIIESLRGVGVAVRLVPNVSEIAQGRVNMADFQELAIDDLLGRAPVKPSDELLTRNIKGKVVMVTGAGGSIGSELCRQILQIGPERLILFEQNEFTLYSIHAELVRGDPSREYTIVALLGSVRDGKRLGDVMESFRPHTIYHAAAYKHVPIVEQNPVEGISNNVLGTLATARVAIEKGVESFVLVSTDKAVRPTNIMGASKRMAELVLQALAAENRDITFSIVRFGNVLGSSGSVVPLFRQQIANGGPITLTDPEMTRYFMTIPEASQLVIQAGAMATGGDVFVLDMGEPVKIIDLARRMVELSGLTIRDEANPDGNIEIVMTGQRPGEKLYEELLIGDNPTATTHPRIMTAHEEFFQWSELQSMLDKLRSAMDANDLVEVLKLMATMVSGYRPSADIVDLVMIRQRMNGNS